MKDPAAPEETLIDLGRRLADAARAVAVRHFRTAVAVDDKADSSPVTQADREAEQAMRRLLEAERPDDGIVGEEFGRTRDDAEYVWVLDPIDGTRQFISGKPTFGTLVALVHRGVPVLGIIDQPAIGERWIGARGHPTTHEARLGRREVRSRACPALDQASLLTTAPELYTSDAARAGFQRLKSATKRVYYGGDCQNYGLLASGFADLVTDGCMSYYDFAALVPVVEGAGGRITDWQGRELREGADGYVVASGDRTLHRKALEILAD